MFAIAPTDSNWFNFLQDNQFNSYVNFWTPTPWNITGLKSGDKLYFMLKSPIRKIGGFGEFVEYKNLTANDAWTEFGNRNGRESKFDFLSSIQKYIDRNSKNVGGIKLEASSYKLGSIVLKNCEFWNEEDYKVPDDYGVSFPKQVVTVKYFPKIYDPFYHIIHFANKFTIIEEPRDNERRLVQIRNGQSIFKGRILKAYNNKCCVTGETIPELLEAAHIQEYRNSNSHNIQNGLLLRVDIHRLYDNNLIFIDRYFIIHVSNYIKDEYYRQFNLKRIALPINEYEHPSAEVLELRRNEFRP